MFNIYAVRLCGGTKHRFLVGAVASLGEAKHIANCATLGNADYAYVKERGVTVFYLAAIGQSYRPQPLTDQPAEPKNPGLPRRKCHRRRISPGQN